MLTRVLTIAAVASGALACSSSSSGQQSGGPCSDSGGPMDARACTVVEAGKVDGKSSADCGAPEASGAPLAALSVTTSSAAGLVPSFSPSISDYYVQCAAGTN